MTLQRDGATPFSSRLPYASFRAADGNRVWLSEYYGRSNLVLLLVGANRLSCLEFLLEDIATNLGSYRSENTEVLLALAGAPPEVNAARQRLKLPYPVLDDPIGEAPQQLGIPGMAGTMAAAIWVADRFGEIVYAWQGSQGQPLPSSEELLSWLRSIELGCPE